MWHGSELAWPSHSRDLTPNDFFVWGHVRRIVYGQRPRTMRELKAKISIAFTKRTQQNVLKKEGILCFLMLNANKTVPTLIIGVQDFFLCGK